MKEPKLVRDFIPSIIKKSGRTCKWRWLDKDEYQRHLYLKMIEEMDEFIEEPSYEEAADMLQVFEAFCRFHNLNIEAVRQAAEKKFAERGGFSGILLESIDDGSR